MAGEEKTEKATPKKRKDTRKKGRGTAEQGSCGCGFRGGNIRISCDIRKLYVPDAFKLYGAVDVIYRQDGQYRRVCDERILEGGYNLRLYRRSDTGGGGCTERTAVIVQTKGLFSMEAMKPKFSRLNPFTGIKRLFSMQALVGLVKGLIEIIVVVAILYFQVMDRINEFKKLIDTDVIKIVAYISETAMSLL